MVEVLLLFTVLCSVLLVETAVDIEKKKVVMKTLEQCRGQEKLPMTWYGFKFSRNEKTGELSMSIKVKTVNEVSTGLAIVFNFWKCDASGNPDSCEQILKDYNATDICTLMIAKDELWTQFMESFTTPLVCPIKPGVYEVKENKISSDFLNYLPVGDALWKIQMEGYDKGEKITCVQFLIQVSPIYVRRKH